MFFYIVRHLDSIASYLGINTKVISFTKVMGCWRTCMRLHAENKLIETEDKNTMWNISRGLTITTAILYLPSPSH